MDLEGKGMGTRAVHGAGPPDPVTGAVLERWVQPGDPILALHTTFGLDAHGNVLHALPLERTLEVLARYGRGPR